MKIGILGSGNVAQTIGEKLLSLGHEVMVSSRDMRKEKTMWGDKKLPSAADWVRMMRDNGFKASGGSFSEAARFGETILNCTSGLATLEVIDGAGRDNFKGKVLVDIANPLDFSKGSPPSVAFCGEESLGERVQKALPDAKVVKTLNTVNAMVMVDPSLVKGDHDMFVAGNDAGSREWVSETLLKKWFGWKSVVDLGDLTAARATESYLPLWLKVMNATGTPHFNLKIVR
ncbi:MAG: NAD(P)-binding domain-containing protein [Candidatus Thermoplasmatota archaeon]|jgi:hypothetical protein|nr:NAD(P)-binding domain-containing protein [Candidatus Thermoplasmatota archaeon]